MTTKHFISVILGFAIISCGSKEKNSNVSDQISGAYAREYSVKVTNLESGKEIGMRTIRDTIVVQLSDEGYKVSNRKWSVNDFDNEGWQDMEHSEERPLAIFYGKFNSETMSLVSDSAPELYFDFKSGQLFKGKNKIGPYLKLN